MGTVILNLIYIICNYIYIYIYTYIYILDIVWSVILATPMNQVIDWLHAEVWYRYKGTWIKWQYDAWVLIVMVMITCIVDKLHGPSKHSMLMYIYMMIHVRTILYTCLLTKNPPPKKMKRTSLHPVVSALRPSLPKGSEHLWASFPKQSLHF